MPGSSKIAQGASVFNSDLDEGSAQVLSANSIRSHWQPPKEVLGRLAWKLPTGVVSLAGEVGCIEFRIFDALADVEVRTARWLDTENSKDSRDGNRLGYCGSEILIGVSVLGHAPR